jgi:hypothetical protein
MPVGRRVKIGSDTRAFSVLYGIDSLPFSEGKPARLIPGKRIIGTAEEGYESWEGDGNWEDTWPSMTATL